MKHAQPSPELLEHEARQLEHTDAYSAAVMRACAKQWREERKDSNG